MRTKKVFRNAHEVIHVWAQQTHEEGRSGNVYFDSYDPAIIYSYGRHYWLAKFLSRDIVLINNTGYSVTTAKHINIVTGATKHYKQYFERDINLGIVYSDISEWYNKLQTARNKAQSYVSNILNTWEKFLEYHEWQRKENKLFKKNYQPYHEDKYKACKKIVDSLNDPNLKERLVNEAAKRKAALKRQQDVKKLEFMTYERNTIHGLEKEILRISEDGAKVETSQGVKVSREDAAKLYAMIKAGRDIKGYKIEYYTVLSINGTLKIGCHNIDIKSVHEIGKQLIK